MRKKKTLINIIILITIQGIYLICPNSSFGQWDNDRIKRPSPRVTLGARVGYDWDKNTYSLGGQVSIPIRFGRGGLQIIPSADVFLHQGWYRLAIKPGCFLSCSDFCAYSGGEV
jgi:hypothetical protein